MKDSVAHFCAILVIVFAISSVLITAIPVKMTKTETEIGKLYHVTAPFGVLWVDEHGSLLFVGSTLSESYIAKYVKDGKLYTEILSSEKPIIVDGTFRLVKVEETSWNIIETFVWTSYYMELHIPYLPELNQTMTDNYIIGG